MDPPVAAVDGGDDIARRIAERTLASRGADYSNEVRRLLDAGREVMARCGTRSRPRVADIVAAAGLSNDAFYRHFTSKDDLVAAILDDGAARLRSYLSHQMAKDSAPDEQVRRWVEGVMAQAVDEESARTTLAVLWNGGALGSSETAPRRSAIAPLVDLLVGPLAELGSTDPDLDAAMIAHGVVGRMSDRLWEGTRPSPAETAHLVAFALAAVRPDPVRSA
ncbi:MAG TPA: TetR/AcrR family transcriptional regulator [Acidimicrobiales bacterium]